MENFKTHNSEYSNHLNTGLVWYSNGRFVSGCQMVWYLNGGLKNPVYGPKCPVFKWSAKSRDLNIGIPDNHTVQHSDEFGIQVFGMVMVIGKWEPAVSSQIMEIW